MIISDHSCKILSLQHEYTVCGCRRWKEVLINRFQTEVDLYRDRVKDLRHIHKAIMQNGGIQCLTPADGISMEDVCTLHLFL